MTTTPKTGAPELATSQASKEISVNEALRRIEAGSGRFRVEDDDATSPPGSCADGAQYIPAATASGAWAGEEGSIAIAVGADAVNGWYFITAEEGMTAWIKDENVQKQYNGAAWTTVATGGDVTGPASSVDNHVAVFDSTSGKVLKDGGVALLANGANLTLAAAPATNAVGFLGAPQMADQDDYTLALADSGGHYYHVSGTPHTLTIPANASIAFPIGTVIAGVNENGAGAITLAITSDTLRWGSSTGSRTIAANGTFSLLKVTSTVWRITGDGIT